MEGFCSDANDLASKPKLTAAEVSDLVDFFENLRKAVRTQLNPVMTLLIIRVGHPFFSKECSDLCVLFRSL